MYFFLREKQTNGSLMSVKVSKYYSF